jgi:hypothetical protein
VCVLGKMHTYIHLHTHMLATVLQRARKRRKEGYLVCRLSLALQFNM